ncbi:MAG: hypothetical protein ABIF82_14200 [Planctomycetota bacterium]
MKYGLVIVGLVVVTTMLMACDTVLAAEKPVTLIGTVSVEKDDDDKVTSVTLTVGETDYSVTLSEVGLKLAALDGKKAEVVAVVTEKDDVKWLNVSTFKEVKDPDDDDE